MKRRQFITAVGAGSAVAMTGCQPSQNADQNCESTSTDTQSPAINRNKTIRWNMVTTWPKNFQGLGEGAEYLAEMITRMSGGRLEVKVFGSGELVPALQVFDAVSSGTAEMGHGGAYYWRGKMPSTPFFSALPFGFNAVETISWLLKGGGYELWRELYEPFGVIPFMGGNSGVQMAGWFNREINSVEDLEGLRMRIPGLGGEVLKRAGGTPVLKAASEVFTSLATGNIDAAEWVGPYNDLAMGLYKAAKYYYYPGWHEPGTNLEAIVNKRSYEALPADLQAIVTEACHASNQAILADFTAKNNESLKVLVEEHQVQLRQLPDDVLKTLKSIADEVVTESVAGDEIGQRILSSYQTFKSQVRAWHEISEFAYTRIID